jgi:hypothetical protein
MTRLTRAPALLGALLGAALAWGAGPARAGTLFSDPYGVGAPDVLGSEANFDIRSLEVEELDRTTLKINLDLNYYGGDMTVSPFAVPGSSFAAVPVGVGDVLIQGRSSLWAIPVGPIGDAIGGIGGISYGVGEPVPVGQPATRIPFFPGSVYLVHGTLDAAQALGVDPADDLRADEPVWGVLEDSYPAFVGSFPVAQAMGGAEIGIQLRIDIGPAFYDDVSDGYRVHFASATCACDVIDGAVPEPAPLALSALAALALTAARARLCLPRRGGSRGRELV